ncbi:hypothetical protein CJU90_0352 [Yarrowia sp. C11]|nr:hypothetical protein CKK34_1763 [Yarrowia sp. E02]KAG5372700.1 hypothetical protein CJU90_0352 [Yarrowia sp. C11]
MPVTRRSLHRQSVMRSAGASTYTNDTDAKVVHWVRQWVSPQQSPNVVSAPSEKRAQTPADAEKGTPASTPVSLSNLNFKVKQWIPDPDQEAHVALKYGSTTDVIAFVTEVHAPVEVKNDNDLTASDIRGAVGGEAIPGMTTMDKQEEGEKPAEPAAATAEEALNNTTIPEAKTEIDSSEMVVDAPEPAADASAAPAAEVDAAPAAIVTETTTTTTTTTDSDAMDVDVPATETIVETKEEVVVPEPAVEAAATEPAASEPAASAPAPVEAPESTVEATETTVTAASTEAPAAAAVEPVVEAPVEPVPEVAPVVAEATETAEPVKTEVTPSEPAAATDTAAAPESATVAESAPAVTTESSTESADVEMKDA